MKIVGKGVIYAKYIFIRVPVTRKLQHGIIFTHSLCNLLHQQKDAAEKDQLYTSNNSPDRYGTGNRRSNTDHRRIS